MRRKLVEFGRRLAAHLPGRWDRRARELGKVLVNYRGARRTGTRAFAFARLARTSPLVSTSFGRGQLLVPTDDQEIGRTVYITGGYERIYMSTAVSYLESTGFCPNGRTFVDVGANIGASTVDALLEFGFARAICFEPQAANFRLLRMNLILNDLDERARAYRLALSDYDGTALLHQMTAANSGDYRVTTSAAIDASADGQRGEEIRCLTLDSLIASGEVTLEELGLIWIDAQGHEASVLAGARTALAARVPVFLEYWPEALGDSLGGLEALIRAHFSTVVDIRLLAEGLPAQATLGSSELGTLRQRYRRSQTDLLLLPVAQRPGLP